MKKLFASLLIFCIMLSGCHTQTQTEEQTTTQQTQAEEPQPYPVTINGVEIEKSPEKIVCLSPALTEILFEMGYGENIIGRSSYCDYPSAVTETQDLGSSAAPDIDRIIQLRPELVLTATAIASRDVLRMSEAGIKTLVISAPTTIEEFSANYIALGLLMNGTFTGREKGEQFFSDISQTLANSSAVSFGSFIYITQNLTIAGGDTFEGAVLSCFGENLAENAEGYSYELSQLLENQPELILLNSNYTIEDLENNGICSQLDAVMNKKVLQVENSYFERPTARIIKFLQNLIVEYKKLSREA